VTTTALNLAEQAVVVVFLVSPSPFGERAALSYVGPLGPFSTAGVSLWIVAQGFIPRNRRMVGWSAGGSAIRWELRQRAQRAALPHLILVLMQEVLRI